MDPDAALQRIAELFRESQEYFGTERGNDAGTELDYLCDDLLNWLSRGGFEPDYSKVPRVVISYLHCRQITFAKRQLQLQP